jgi:hypothetical protein
VDWSEACARIAALGDGLDGEGIRHLTRQVVLALQEELEHGDPAHPTFHRYEEPWAQWGGPNPDNVYVRARVDPARSYVVRGDVTGLRQAIFSLHDGDMHEGRTGVFSECTLDELAVGDGGRLEIAIAPERPPDSRNWMALPSDARILTIRQYQSDWERDAIAAFDIECSETRGLPPPPPTTESVAGALDRAVAWAEASMAYWERYTDGARAALPRNGFTPPGTPAGGAPTIGYGAGHFALGPGEALLVESDVPDADYWTWTLHTMRWLESGDFASRQTSLNHLQAHTDGDGRVRLVAAAEDPGAPNWIDVGGHPEGLLVYRYIGARTKPVPTARVVPIDSVRARLPADHPVVSPDDRRERLARRRAAVLRRYC